MPAGKSPEQRRIENAERMRRWRANNKEVHCAREKARYYKKREEDPDSLRKKSAENMRKWRRENPEKARALSRKHYRYEYHVIRQLRTKYGLTKEEFDAMLTSQGNACAVCGGTPERGLCVDHDHATGLVRGILCHPCNTALGFLGDCPDRLIKAAEYLRGRN